MKLNAKQLRDLEEKEVQGELRQIKRIPLYFILENIYDTYNIGGLFRLADALAIEKVYLCGDTEIPPNSRIKKASIGTYKVVPWEYKETAGEAISELRRFCEDSSPQIFSRVNSHPSHTFGTGDSVSSLGIRGAKRHSLAQTTDSQKNLGSLSDISIIAVEQSSKAVDYTKVDYKLPLALVFGNETYGVTAETLKLCDQIVEIPMWGINKSLNVIVSAGIVSYFVVGKVR